MDIQSLLEQLSNKTALLILMAVLIVFIILLTTLGIVFIVALRKRRPVVKVVMAPMMQQEMATMPEVAPVEDSAPASETDVAPAPVAEPEPEEEEEDDEVSKLITEGHESVRYNRSFTAKISQLSNEAKEWYSALKNELLSYEKVKDRMSWKRETYRIGRIPVARLVVRGKTLCLLLAVEPLGYNNTKYVVEDVSDVANTVDTPTMYRVKSARRLKYAKEMIAGMMKEFKAFKNPLYEDQDFFLPYEGDMSLIQRGLVKRVVTNSTRTYKIEEIDDEDGDGEE